MMRKHMSLVVGGVVVLILACLLAFVLWQKIAAFGEARTERELATGRLTRLTRRAVFPSQENVEALKQQIHTFESYLASLDADMRDGQLMPPSINRSQFAGLYEEMLSRLEDKAKAKGVSVPPAFSFGFQRYATGSIPAPEDVDRLAIQLQTVEVICTTLLDAGIHSLLQVERPVFEASAQADAAGAADDTQTLRRRRRGGEAEAAVQQLVPRYESPDGLFTREHYVLAFRAHDGATAKILDAFAEQSPFTVVTRLEVANPAKPVIVPPKSTEETAAGTPASGSSRSGPAGATAARGDVAPELLPRELRVVAGKEIPNVRMELDVYRFRVPDAEEAQEDPS